MMASDPNSELSLECKPHSYSMLLKSVGKQQQSSDQTHHKKLEEFLACLEEERLKIDAFKRELPLCMQLLTNAMETSRQQLHSYRAKPVVEEFIPLKHPSSNNYDEGLIIEKTTNPSSDKANWMTSAQLWSQASGDHNHQETKQHESSDPKDSDMGFVSVNLKQGLEFEYNNQRTNGGGGGAFIPFSKERNRLPELALANSSLDDHNHKEIMEEKNNNSQMNTTTINNGVTHRKARRCWSPDLHRRFVNALQILGGSQVATPKQIIELMKVDGLTNDEVKSHLQKYRLHTRRPSPSPQAAAAAAAAPQLVVLGGIWVPTEYAAAAHHGGHHPTTHHPSPAHYCATGPVPQEFYAAPTPPQAAAHHHQIHVYQPASQTQGKPESDVHCGTGDRSESIEDVKSESSSWKADSNGERNGGERKGLGLRGEEGEESNGSEITLKF